MKLKFEKQLDGMDCGPACLRMVASFYGKNLPMSRLRTISHISRDGVSMLGISRAAEEVGFRTVGGRFTFDTLLKKVPLPCIVHWKHNHFVVVYKIKQQKKGDIIYVADPAKGLIKYSKKDFISNWTSTLVDGEDRGLALVLQPTSLLFQQKESENTHQNKLKFLFSYFIEHKRFFAQLVIGLLVGSLLQLVFPFLTQVIVDIGIADHNIGFIWLVLIAQLMLFFGRISIDFIRSRILLHISARMSISLVSDFFIKLMKLPMKFFDTKLIGDLLQRIGDHDRLENFITSQSLSLLFSLFSFIVFGTVLLIYSPKIFLIFIVGSILYGCWLVIFLKRRRVINYELFERRAAGSNKTYQLLTSMQEIKLQGIEQRKRWEWEDTQADLFETNMKELKLEQVQRIGSIGINEVKNILISVIAATSVIHGDITLGMMLSIQYMIGQLNGPIEQILGFLYSWQDVSISLERLYEIHQQEEESVEDREIMTLASDHSISIDNLSFDYGGALAKKVLKNIDLIIPEGEVTAIVGASGSGKTTLIKLLLGYYDTVEGNIAIGSTNLSDINLSWWRKQCGAVMQDGYMFSESIAKNIAIVDENIDTDRLEYACRLTNIHDFVISLPNGYNTIIGQDGQDMSLGQKQRVLIARIVYKNPDFIFLDEATNALDANNEKVIIENLSKFYKGKTVVVVAHRLSTVKNADQIIVLDDGRIAEKGKHKDLVAKKGEYFKLVKNQLELGN